MATYTIYAGTNDGYIQSHAAASWLSARAGNDLGAVTGLNGTAGAQAIFDSKVSTTTYDAFQSFEEFDTSVIGDSATVLSVDLQIYAVFVFDGDPLHVVLAKAASWGPTLTTGDWIAGSSLSAITTLATLDLSVAVGSAYNTFTESGTNFRSAVNKTGMTGIRLYGSRQESTSAPTPTLLGEITYANTSRALGNYPRLIVETDEVPASFVASATGVSFELPGDCAAISEFSVTVRAQVDSPGETDSLTLDNITIAGGATPGSDSGTPSVGSFGDTVLGPFTRTSGGATWTAAQFAAATMDITLETTGDLNGKISKVTACCECDGGGDDVIIVPGDPDDPDSWDFIIGGGLDGEIFGAASTILEAIQIGNDGTGVIATYPTPGNGLCLGIHNPFGGPPAPIPPGTVVTAFYIHIRGWVDPSAFAGSGQWYMFNSIQGGADSPQESEPVSANVFFARINAPITIGDVVFGPFTRVAGGPTWTAAEMGDIIVNIQADNEIFNESCPDGAVITEVYITVDWA